MCSYNCRQLVLRIAGFLVMVALSISSYVMLRAIFPQLSFWVCLLLNAVITCLLGYALCFKSRLLCSLHYNHNTVVPEAQVVQHLEPPNYSVASATTELSVSSSLYRESEEQGSKLRTAEEVLPVFSAKERVDPVYLV
jgi:hypothetical protein